MKYALIGCGRISTNHVKAVINNQLEFVAVCDVIPEHMENVLAKHDLQNDTTIKRYTDYKKLLEENEIDLVAINEAKRTIYFAEIKRNPDKVDFSILQSKVQVFLSCNPQYVDYDRTLNGLSLSELAACSKLPFED